VPDEEDLSPSHDYVLRRDLPHDPDLGPEGETAVDGPVPSRPGPLILLAVLTGGLAGTLARYEVAISWAAPAGHFPEAIFAINTSGSFLLGLLLTALLRPPPHFRALRALLGTGLLGGWTTYSTVAVGASALTKQGHLPLAAAYLGASLAAGLVAVGLGMALGRALAGVRWQVATTQALAHEEAP
jgi:fluoride exporter